MTSGKSGAALLSALVPSVDLGYADYQARVSWKLSPESSRASNFLLDALSGPIELPSPKTWSVTPCLSSPSDRPS